jgi:hypothetical protein
MTGTVRQVRPLLMKLEARKQTVAGGLLALSVAGAALATVPAVHAAAGDGGAPDLIVPTGLREVSRHFQ